MSTMSCNERKAHVGLIALDAKRLSRHLRHDITNDWFPDPLGYLDLLDPDRLAELLDQRNRRHRGLPVASKVRIMNVPKTKGTLRYSAEFAFLDRAIYHGLVDFIASEFDDLLSPVVFGHRVERHDSRSTKHLFRPGVEMWSSFRHYVRLCSEGKYVVCTDIQGFYENLRFADIQASLQEGIAKIIAPERRIAELAHAISLLTSLLPHWMFSKTQGLPQNIDASAFIANQAIRRVDEAMLRLEYTYCRYMDDIRIVCNSSHECRKAIQQLSEHLRPLNLGLNASKTEILRPGTKEHKEKALLGDDNKIRDIANMWRSKSIAIREKAIPHLLALAADELDPKRQREGRPLASERQFRFALTRISQIANCPDVGVSPETWRPIVRRLAVSMFREPATTQDIADALKAMPVSARTLDRIESALLCDRFFLYDWQRHTISLFLLEQRSPSARLLDAAQAAIEGKSRLVSNGVAFLILGASGDISRQRLALRHFPKLSGEPESFDATTQRLALLSIHELNYREDIEPVIAQKDIHPDNKGILLERKDGRPWRGVYFKKRPTTTLSDLGVVPHHDY